MSKIWCTILIISIAFSFFVGTQDGILGIITEASYKAIENILVIAGMTCFWSGIFNILKHTKIINFISRVLKPFIIKLFPDKLTEQELENISLNMASNLIGVGNAATVYAVKTIEEMQKSNENKKYINNNMSLFVLINTASIQLIPTNMLSLRLLYGSTNSNLIILPNLVVSTLSLFVGIVSLKIVNMVRRKC